MNIDLIHSLHDSIIVSVLFMHASSKSEHQTSQFIALFISEVAMPRRMSIDF